MQTDKHVTGIFEACIRNHSHSPGELLRWLATDVMMDMGVKQSESPPADLLPWLRETSAMYARAVMEHPLQDILGRVYEELSSHGHRKGLGQFFTPSVVAEFMAQIALADHPKGEPPDGKLWRMCEPACGSGALVLGFLQHLDPAERRRWSITCIDLDGLCAQMCAAQLMANLFIHRLEVGELLVYRGNALGPASGLRVLLHATMRDLSPDLVLPALHPARIAALRTAQQQVLGGTAQPGPAPDAVRAAQASAPRKERAPRAAAAGATQVGDPPQKKAPHDTPDPQQLSIDLFAD
jgi:hypothetical protein